MTIETATVPANADTTGNTGVLSAQQMEDRLLSRMEARRVAEPKPAKTVIKPIVADEGAEDVVDDDAGAGDEGQESDAPTQGAEGDVLDPDADNQLVEEGEDGEPAAQTLQPPPRWDAKEKEVFAKLDPEAQEVVLNRDKLYQAEVTKAQQASAAERKLHEAARTAIREKIEAMQTQEDDDAKVLDDWDKWFSSDEAKKLAKEHPGKHYAERQEYEEQRKAFEGLKTKRIEAEKTAHAAHWAQNEIDIPKIVPALADPKHGDARNKQLNTYLVDIGFTQERIRWVTPQELKVAYQSMLYEQAQKKAKAPIKEQPKPTTPAGPTVGVRGQGNQRGSALETEFKQLNAKATLTADEATRRRELRGILSKK